MSPGDGDSLEYHKSAKVTQPTNKMSAVASMSQSFQVMIFLTKAAMKRWYLKVHLFIQCPQGCMNTHL